MCGRYTIVTDAKALEARFQAYLPPSQLAPSYNAAPSQGLPTILNANPYVITVSAWGFRPEWADWRDIPPVINARAETPPAQAQACLKPFPAHLLRLTAVSPKVNSPASNTPELLQLVADDASHGAPQGQKDTADTGSLFPASALA